MSTENKTTLTLSTLDSKKAGTFLFLCCFVSYMFVYLARYNLTAALPLITDAETGILAADKAGLIGTSLMVAYGIGQLINGFIAEKFPPFGLIGFSILLSAAANTAMYFVVTFMNPTLPLLCVFWAINGYSQSFIWPTFMRTMAIVLPEDQRIKYASNMLMSTAFGFIVAYGVSSLVLGITGTWEPLFLTAAIIVGAVGAIWLIFTHPLAKKVYTYNREARKEDASPEKPSSLSDKHKLLPLLLISGVFIILVTNVSFPIVKNGISDWMPTMVKEEFGMAPAFAVAVSIIIPVVCIPGAALSRILMQKVFHDEMRTCTFLFALSALILVFVGFFTLNCLWPTLILLAIASTLMLGVNTMTVSLVPLRFAKYGKTATVTGIINAVAAASGGVATYITGVFKMNFGWQTTIYILAGVALLGLAASLAVTRRWIKFKKM